MATPAPISSVEPNAAPEQVAPTPATADRHDLSDILAQLEDEPDEAIAPTPELGSALTDARDLDRPKAAETVVTTDGGLEFDPSFASFGKRFLALLVDSVMLTLAMIPGIALITISDSAPLAVLGVLVCVAAFFLVAVAYARGVSNSRQWIGNRIAGTYVVDAVNGKNLDVASALTRFMVRHVVSSLLLVGFLVALADNQRRTFHDRFASSVVIGREREVWTADD